MHLCNPTFLSARPSCFYDTGVKSAENLRGNSVHLLGVGCAHFCQLGPEPAHNQSEWQLDSTHRLGVSPANDLVVQPSALPSAQPTVRIWANLINFPGVTFTKNVLALAAVKTVSLCRK